MRFILLFFTLLLSLKAETLHILAAANLSKALETIKQEYIKNHKAKLAPILLLLIIELEIEKNENRKKSTQKRTHFIVYEENNTRISDNDHALLVWEITP